MTWSARVLKKRVLTTRPPRGHHRMLSYLPLNHVAGQMLDIVAPLAITSEKNNYVTIYFPAQCYIKTRLCSKEQLKDAKPTVFLGVPKVWDGLKQKLDKAFK